MIRVGYVMAFVDAVMTGTMIAGRLVGLRRPDGPPFFTSA
jgi:hypothetical protein